MRGYMRLSPVGDAVVSEAVASDEDVAALDGSSR